VAEDRFCGAFKLPGKVHYCCFSRRSRDHRGPARERPSWRRYASGRSSRLKVRRQRGEVKAIRGHRLAIVELANAGFADGIMLIRGWSSVTFCPYNVRRDADGLSCTNTLSDGAGVQTFVTTLSASSAADSRTVRDSTPVLPTLHVVGTSVAHSAIHDECRVSSDVVARYNCCWTGLPTPRRRLSTAIQRRHAEHRRGTIKLRLMSPDGRVDRPDARRRSRRCPLTEGVTPSMIVDVMINVSASDSTSSGASERDNGDAASNWRDDESAEATVRRLRVDEDRRRYERRRFIG